MMLTSLKDSLVLKRDRLDSPLIRRRAGWTMIGSGALGLLIAVVGSFVGWRLVGSINSATSDTLDVTIESLDSMENTIDVADGMVVSTSEALGELETTLLTLSASLDSGANVVDDAGQLSGTAGPALADASVTFRQLEGIGAEIDALLGGLAALPFSPDFDPESGLSSTFGRLADDLEPLPQEFTNTADSLAAFSVSLDQLESDVDALAITVGGVNNDLLGSEELLDRYRNNVIQAQAVAEASRSDLDREQGQLRIIIIIAAINFAAAQIVPLWLGSELLAGARRRDRDLRLDPGTDNTMLHIDE